MKRKNSWLGNNTGSLPGLAAVLLVMVIASIGFTSAINLPDPQENLAQANGLLQAFNTHRIVGSFQAIDGSLGHITSNADPDYVESINKFATFFTAYPVYFAVVYAVPNSTATAFTAANLGAVDNRTNAAFFLPRCITAFNDYLTDIPPNSPVVKICAIPQDPGGLQRVTILPAGTKRQ